MWFSTLIGITVGVVVVSITTTGDCVDSVVVVVVAVVVAEVVDSDETIFTFISAFTSGLSTLETVTVHSPSLRPYTQPS